MTVDLTTRYLGLTLRSPLVASAAPHNSDQDHARRLERAGIGAIVLPSLFEEEIEAEEDELDLALAQGTEQFAEALDYFPALPSFLGAADRYLMSLERVRAAVTVPVIASLNARSAGGWIHHARRIEAAGADALELNLYHVPSDPGRTAAGVEAADLALIAAVRAAISIPLAVKFSPFYSAFAHVAAEAVAAGADGLVLFNRFYQPDLDLETLSVEPRLELSTAWELRLPLRWTAILRPQLGPDVSIAATSGIGSGGDALKALLVGADVAMMTSAILRLGPDRVATVEAEMRAWMAEHEYESVAQLRGSASSATAADPTAFERANYIKTIRSLAASTETTGAAPRR